MLETINITNRRVVTQRPAPSTALRHWAMWSLDYGSWRRCCHSIESRYAREQERFKWPGDAEVANRERYDQLTAEAVEDIVREMPTQERDLLRLIYIEHPQMDPGHMARRMGMSAQHFELLEMAAHTRFARIWRGEGNAAAS
ncbi:sigma-70 family RNA polymerase sigma factor [Chitiniphilus eburneus]|uniref:Sigma-70 family RNA polymerase sigma factor n=1 Tax=Chitiniphilus eburneus TaxID=2571148 RepID=A0A4U0Q3E3_9NEIS|nr:sigma-70 family RNA polymerase sigma factor [Chitiniphilus eburneus]TJZ75593.1 sigma-70 family RNA polymerase sigma factor [Chitiniphilus eburneus]